MDVYMFTINRHNTPLSVNNNSKSYILCFKNIVLARKVHYNLEVNPKILFLDEHNSIDSGTLFIPKNTDSTIDAMSDGAYYLQHYNYKNFLEMFHDKNIVIPLHCIDETPSDFMFKSVKIVV